MARSMLVRQLNKLISGLLNMLMNHVNLAKLVQAEPIKKHGENNFCVVLLAHAETQDEANKKEIELIEILQTRGITSNKR